MVEQADFKILEKVGTVEIRHYPKMILAVVEGLGDNEAFGHLFRYISGENVPRQKIEMTAPVISSQKIEMTVPVISGSSYMAFVLPSGYTIENAPRPSDPKVHLVEKNGRIVAAIRFRGRAGENQVHDKMNELIKTLRQHDKKIMDEPFLMRYNPPFIPGFLRHNEIGVEID
jgi:hypothetical protein